MSSFDVSEQDLSYVGEELKLFAEARIWKGYVARQVAPFLGSDVLEVGAGLGATAAALLPAASTGGLRRWVCLEPDPKLRRELTRRIRTGGLAAECEAASGTIASLPEESAFDTILYMDVLEHIEDDDHEVEMAVRRLRPGGHLVVLAPAHDALFTPFDEAVGHFRRYDRSKMRRLSSSTARLVRLRYLDCVGLAASAGNRFVLSSAMPSSRQLWVWDRIMVRASKWLDPLFGYRLGKSVLGVWRRGAEDDS
ncbi:MAG: class I SAM-dependent methyltransferase [Thermoanaerobaculia bacterium]|nr:class I SAM-dependent methyltransferase [Thermoanaerobaculia bacterium]